MRPLGPDRSQFGSRSCSATSTCLGGTTGSDPDEWCRNWVLPHRDKVRPDPILFKLVRNIEPIKARGVIDKELSFAFLAKVFSLKKEIDRAVEAVSVGNIRAIEPALIAKLLDRKREQFLVNFEAKINLSAFDVFHRQMLGVVAPPEVFSGAGAGKPAVISDSLHETRHPGATRLEKGNAQIWVAIGDALRNHPVESKLNCQPKRNGGFVMMGIIDVA